MFQQARALIWALITLVVVMAAALIYWRGSSNATTRAALVQARGVITEQRRVQVVEQETDTRVNTETVETNTRALEADREIQAIRDARRTDPVPAPARPAGSATSQVDHGDLAGAGPVCDAGCTRVLQLAREARAAAVESSARLQPTRTGAR